MDLSRLSTADLEALAANDLSRVSTNGLRILQEMQAGPAPKARFSGGDTLRSVGQGALGGIKALTDVFGAGNAASNILEAGATRLQEGMTAGRKAELEQQAKRMKAAEASGDVKEEAKAALSNLLEAPLQATAQGVGFLLPFAATSVAGGVAKLLPATIRTIQTVMGAGMGAGAVKGSIYDAVYQQNIDDGKSPAVAHEQATAAQEYVGKNAEQIAVGTGLGAVAARTGAEKLLTKGAEKGLAASAAKRVGKAVLEEVPMEAAQGGQERLAANLALQREGVDVPTFRGVAGQALQEGLTAGMAAGPLAAYRSPRAGLAAKAREEEQAQREAALAAQEQAETERRAARDYIPSLLQQSQQYAQQIKALKEASSVAKDADPVAKAMAQRAKAELSALESSDAYQQHKAELVDAAPQIQALQQQREQEAEAQAKAEHDALNARLQDPAIQGPLYAEYDSIQTALQTNAVRAEQALKTGDMDAVDAAETSSVQLRKKLEELQSQLGQRPQAPTAPRTEEQLRARLKQLTSGAYSDAIGAGRYEDAAAIKQQVADIHSQLSRIEQDRKAVEMALPITEMPGTVKPMDWQAPTTPKNEPSVGRSATDVALEAAFGAAPIITQGDIRGVQRIGPLQRAPKAAEPKTTTSFEQEGLFPDMEPGGSAGTPVENLRAQIDTLRNRPNMPQQTLAQLENYQRVLDNPALADTENPTAQNALERIKENVERIAYRGEGAGEERAMGVGELNARIAELRKRRVQMGKSLAQSQADMRAASPETAYARSQEHRNLRRESEALANELTRLEAQLQSTDTSYPVRPTKYVTLDKTQRTGEVAYDPTTGLPIRGSENAPVYAQEDVDATGGRKPVELQDATDEQIARARRGDNRGREVATVNAEPSTITEQTPLTYPGMEGEVATRTDERVGYGAPTATGSARITRISERTIGQTREGPSDAELNDTLRALSPADEQTLNLWDPVFGQGSPAALMVNNAEVGLRKAMDAVRDAETAVDATNLQLEKHRKTLAEAQAKDPYTRDMLLMSGQEYEMYRGVAGAEAQYAAAEARAASERSALAQNTSAELRTQQEIINEAQQAMSAAQQNLYRAQMNFKKEFIRLQRTGELTPELVKFVGTRSLKEDLAKAQADIAELSIGDDEFAGQARAMFGAMQKSASSIKTALQAQALIQSFVPEVRARLGARAAKLADTVLRLQAARNIVGVGMELKQALDQAQREAKQIDKDMAARIKRATAAQAKTLKGVNAQLKAINARAEISRIELDAAQQKVAALQKTLEKMRRQREELEGAPTRDARAAVQKTEKELTARTEELQQLQRTANERITEARTNLQRAKATQQSLFENEQALRKGESMPLLQQIKAAVERIHGTDVEQEADASEALAKQQAVADGVASDISVIQQQTDVLDRVEADLTRLLQKHISDFTEVQDEVATLLDTSALLSSSVFDPEGENAQRIVDRAGTRAQVNALAEEEARTISQRDKVITAILAALDSNAYQISETPNPQYYKSAESEVNRYALLQQQRKRLFAQYSEKEALFTNRLQRLRDKKAALEPELFTAPDPALKDWGRTQIETLQGMQGRMQAEISGLKARIDSIRKARTAKVSEARAQGEASLQELRSMGLSDRQKRAPKLMDDLVASLRTQFVEMKKADKRVQDAYQKMRKARSALFAFDPYNDPRSVLLGLQETARAERDAFRAAALDRAKLHDDLVSLERMQLSLAQEIIATPAVKEALPVPKQKEAPQAPVQVTTEPVTPERWGSMTSALAEGRVKGPETEQETPEIAAFRQRVDSTDNVRGLRKELGSLRSEYAALIEEYQTTPAGKTLTRGNASLVRTVGGRKIGNTYWAREALQATKDTKMRNESLALFDKIRILEERIDAVASGRVPSLERIATTQPKAGRRGPASKKEAVAGDWRTGSVESREGALATGTRNRATEAIKPQKVTSEQAVAQARVDTGEGMVLRLKMEQAKLERDLDQARAERAQAKERHDAVMAAPRASEAAKQNVKDALEAAEAKVKEADAALVKGTRASRITPQDEGEAASQFRSDREHTEVDDDTVIAVVDGRILDAAKLLAARGSTPEVRARAAKLVPLLTRTKLKTAPVVLVEGVSVAGKFDPATNTITMAPGGINEEDLLHEMTHAVTDNQLTADESTLTPDQRAAKRELEGMRRTVSALPQFDNEDIGNVREFASEVYSNQSLRDKLDRIGKPRSFLQRFVDAVKRLLGWGTPQDPLSKKAEALVERLMRPSRAVPKSTAGAVPSVFRKPKYDTDSAVGKLAAEITAAPVDPMQRVGKNAALALEMWGADMRAPLIKALSVAGDKTLTQASYYVRKADALMNHVYAALGSGPLHLKKDAKGFFAVEAGNGPGMQAILDAVDKVKGVSVEDKMAKAQAYLVAQRADRVGWDKLDFNPKIAAKMQQLADAMRKELAVDPEQKKALEAVRRVYNEYNKGMVGFLAESGYLSKAKAADLLRHGDYVPFYRVNENGVAEFVMGENTVIHVGDLRNNKFLAPLVGDDQKLLPLNEAMIRNTMLLTDLSMKNLASKDVAYALQKIGVGKIRTGKGPADEAVVRFRQEPNPLDPDDNGERYIRVNTSGTAVEHIPSEMLVKSLEGSFSTLPAGLKAAAWFGDLLRSGVTRNPMYIARQLVRDPMSATFTGGLESGIVTSVFKSLGNFTEQMAGRSKEGTDLLRKGLIHSGIFTGDVDDINKMALQLAGGDQSAFKKTLAWWDKAAMNADAATRIQLYKDALGKGMSEVEAEFAAMEMMNFNKRGLSPTVQYAARMIPFLNAQIQGLNVLFKAMTGNMPQNEKLQIKEKFYRRAMTMALFTMAYAMAMEDDDTYENARPRDKYSNWFLPNPLGGEAIKVPIPFEVGLLFKTIPEAMVDVMKGDFGEQEWKAIKQSFTHQIPGASSYGLPQAIRPTIEVIANHNFFTGREIESRTDAGKVSQERFGPGTTEIAKEMSGVLNAMGLELSPKQIDHLVSGYLGTLPVIVARLTNNVFSSTEGPVRPADRGSDNPIFGSLFQREIGGGPVDAAYAQQEALEKAKKSYDDMVAQGRKADAEAFKENVLSVLGSPEMANRWKAQATALSKQEKAARLQIKDPDALREKLDEIERKRNEAAKMYVTAVQQIAK